MKNNENIICQRCGKKEVLFFCHSCPKKFSKFCSDCDTFIHSIIPYKNLHLRDKIEIPNNDKFEKMCELQTEKIKELEEKNNYQNDVINKLNLKIEEFKKNIYQLTETIKSLNRDKDIYLNELNKLNYLKKEIEKYKKENKSIKESLNENQIKISELNNELNLVNDKFNLKEAELDEIKYYYNNKISDSTKEQRYLLKEIDTWNNNLIELNIINKEKIKENEQLKNKIVNLEEENYENLKIIADLRKENKELIRRLNNNFIRKEY